MNKPESNMKMGDEVANQEDELHICKGYVLPEALPLNQSTIKPLNVLGYVPLLNFSESEEASNSREYNDG